MKNVFRPVSGLFALCILFASAMECRPDFSLRIDNSNARQVGQFFEVDAFFQNNTNPPGKIQTILLSLGVFPRNDNDPIDQIRGVEFVGLVNPAENSLFSNPQIGDPIFGDAKLTIASSLISPNQVDAISGKKAFTVLLRSTLSNPVDVKVDFLAGLYEVGRTGNEGNPVPFSGLSTTGFFTISAVPEPATWVLASLGLGGIALRKRLSRTGKATPRVG